MEVEFRLLKTTDDRSQFSSGNIELDRFFSVMRVKINSSIVVLPILNGELNEKPQPETLFLPIKAIEKAFFAVQSLKTVSFMPLSQQGGLNAVFSG